jgi:hypothetical protein
MDSVEGQDPMANPRCASLLLLCSLLAIGGSGCGSGVERPDLGFVSGKVTMDGKPVENIIVVMKPDSGRAAMVRSNKEGFYDIEYTQDEKGTKLGPTTVSLEWPLGEPGWFSIPQKYIGDKSELKLEVKPGKQTFDIALVPEPEVRAGDQSRSGRGKGPKKPIPPVD